MLRRSLAALAVLCAAAPLRAQTLPADGAAVPRRQVISFQPIGAVLTVYAAEYERVITPVLTLGVGGTGWFPDDFSYTSGDLKLRYYPQGRPLQGFGLGASVGVTRISEDFSDEFSEPSDESSASGPSVGFMLDYGSLLGATRRLYIGVGAGAKVVFVDDADFDGDVTLRYPTGRVSIGYAF